MSNPPHHPLEPIIAGALSFWGRTVSFLLVVLAGSCLGFSLATKSLVFPIRLFHLFWEEGFFVSSLASPPSALSLLALGVGFIVYVRFNLRPRVLAFALVVAALQSYCAGHWVWVRGSGGLS